MDRLIVASVCLVFLTTALPGASAGMTMDQVKNAMKMLRNVCQGKAKVSSELVDGIQEGQFPEERTLKCYMKCVMGMMQSMKGGKLKTEAAISQIKMVLPDEIKDRVIATMEACKNSADGLTDACEVAYAATKCVYEADPE
ncbi:hypothetical protein L9F63_007584, partial [Diploptera punctata]